MRSRLKSLYDIVKQSALHMSDDQGPMMGAALAYYMMFSIAPLLVFAIAAASVVFGSGARADVFNVLKGQIGAQGADAVQSMVGAAAAKPHAGAIATVIGVVTLLVGASGVFQQLQQSLNIIWRAVPKPGATWRIMVRQRLMSFGMVAVMGFLLLVSLIVSAAISAVSAWASRRLPGTSFLWIGADFLISLTIISWLFAAVLKILPDVRLSWKDVRAGGVMTALLFVIGKIAIGAYLGRSSFASGYGAAGSLIVVLLWVFFSSQILFFGAEVTRTLVLRSGKTVVPKAGAALAPLAFPTADFPEPPPVIPAAVAGGAPAALPRRERRVWLLLSGGAAVAGAFLLTKGRKSGHETAGAFACGLAAGVLALLETPEAFSNLDSKIPKKAEIDIKKNRRLERLRFSSATDPSVLAPSQRV